MIYYFTITTLGKRTNFISAQHMSKQFPGSAVLEQNSEGVSVLVAFSLFP